jgi:uracil-DNA glycosylase
LRVVSGTRRKLELIHRELDACRACPNMIGPVVHGPPIASRVLLIGQAPGPREGSLGRPFAWTAGKTLFRWFEEAAGIDEATVREHVYLSAVARCFPGKARGGGDRRPDRDEIANCRGFLEREARALEPELVIPVGTLAIAELLGPAAKLVEVVGIQTRARVYGVEADVIALPHPSGASSWPKVEPGKTLLASALAHLGRHPAIRALSR